MRVVLFFHGGAYHLGSPARLRGLLALLSAAARARVLSAGYPFISDSFDRRLRHD